jgi:hypothetical protein
MELASQKGDALPNAGKSERIGLLKDLFYGETATIVPYFET